MQQFTVDYFIEKFKAIPDALWATGIFRSNDRACALGHCGMWHTERPTDEAKALAELLLPFARLDITKQRHDWVFYVVHPINDGHDDFEGLSPKARMLTALYNIKKMNEAQEGKTEIREVIRYVSVPETIKEQSKELILQ